MKPRAQNLFFLLSCLINISFNLSAYCEPVLKTEESSYVFVKAVRPEGNTIMEDSLLEKPLNMGPGIYLAPELLDMIAEEIEGFYSSSGFHRVKAYVSQPKSIKGTLALNIIEEPEIKLGKTENLRAKIAVDRLIDRNKLKASNETKKKAVVSLTKLYQLKRDDNAKTERLRVRSERARAKSQREHYLDVLLGKQEIEKKRRLDQRENLIEILTRQKEFMVELKNSQAENLEKMRRRAQVINKKISLKANHKN